MRTLSSFEQLLATVEDDALRLHQYASGTIEARLPGGAVTLCVATDYPWDGRVEVAIERSPADPLTIGLRVPAWCRTATLTVAGVERPVDIVEGRISVRRAWAVDDQVVLNLSMPPRFTVPDPRIDSVRGCVAIELGPLVYCLEEADLPPGVKLADVSIDTTASLTVMPERDALLGTLPIGVTLWNRARPVAPWPYADLDGAAASGARPAQRLDVTVHPYQVWANRGDGAMRVWIPVAIPEAETG